MESRFDSVETFGSIDADSDEYLADTFQDHDAYKLTKSHKRFLVVGRKGSGKTAIFKQFLATRDSSVFTFGHTFSEYPWHHHKLQETSGVPAEHRYIHSWKYLILMSLSKILLNQDASQPWSDESLDELAIIERFVVDTYGSRDPDVSQVFSPGKRLKIRPHFKISAVIDAGISLEQLPMNYLPKIASEVNSRIEKAVMTCLHPEHDYFICFDELDLGFDPEDQEYQGLIVGLLLAAKQLNQAAKRQDKNFSVLVFLRDDIYEETRFEDKNKITENHLALIEWDRSGSQWTLKSLMEKRFQAIMGVSSWDQVFDEDKEMRGRQNKYQHLLQRTFNRPRDIIKFCNVILQAHKKRDLTDPLFRNEDIYEARPEYSAYLLKELDDEIHKHHGEYKEWLEVLKRLDSLTFTKEDFTEAANARGILKEKPDMAINLILANLFKFSVIGYQRTGGVGGGSQFVFRYLEPRSSFDETATKFKVHQGFTEAFGLKMYTKG